MTMSLRTISSLAPRFSRNELHVGALPISLTHWGSSPMRIVHAVRQFHPSVGGLENVVQELASEQLANGHSVRIITLDRIFGSDGGERLPRRETIAGLDVVRVPFRGSTRYPLAWTALRHIGDADLVHVHGIDFFFDYFAWTAPLHRHRLVVSTHGGFFHTPYARQFKRLYFHTVTRASLSRYSGVAAVSAADHALFRSIRGHGISLIENGANVDKFADSGARRPIKSILTLGRFSTNKRLDRVITFAAALRRHDPAWTLKIAGRPSDLSLADVMALADSAGLNEGVEVVLYPSDDDIRSLMGECSVLVSASEYEGFGLTAVEGLSAGLYPVLSDIPPFRRLAEQTGFGAILDFSDAETAAARFHSLWNGVEKNYDAHRHAAMAASARYAWRSVSAQYEVFYRAALGIKERSILGVPIGVKTFSEAVDLLDVRAREQRCDMVIFANAHTLNQAIANERARAALQSSIVFNDGIGIDIASRLLFGRRFPANLNGTDFVPRYLRNTRHRYRLFLLGGRPGVATSAAFRLLQEAPQHEIAGCHHGYLDADETPRLIDRIRRSNADVLLVAMGDPKQELWLMENLAKTGCRLGLGVGGLFDFMAGNVPRAPQWIRKVHMEWLYRMLQEPRRMWRRYLIGMPIFLLRVGRQWIAGVRISSVME